MRVMQDITKRRGGLLVVCKIFSLRMPSDKELRIAKDIIMMFEVVIKLNFSSIK